MLVTTYKWYGFAHECKNYVRQWLLTYPPSVIYLLGLSPWFYYYYRQLAHNHPHNTVYLLCCMLCQENNVASMEGKREWRELVNAALPLYKLTYMGCNCPKKFHKIWAAWAEARHLTV